jgi:hypothetical protein
MPTLLYYFGRVRELGLRESARQFETIVAARAVRTIHSVYDRYFRPTEEEHADEIIKKLDANAFNEIRKRNQPRFFLDRGPDFYRTAIREFFLDDFDKIVAAADRIVAHEFDLLASGPRRFDKLPWHEDFKSGHKWEPGTHYREIRYGHLPGVDVKVPWELSRFQHSAILGEAYWLTGDERYAREFRSQVLDWIVSNRYKRGVNWACTMDVGIRAVNWIWGFYFFRESSALDSEFLPAFLRSLVLHARFIRSNLEYRTATVRGETRRLNSNHYLSNLIGLLYIALLFPELAAPGDLEFAKTELFTEIFEQTYADGADYEHSTFYHRLVTEIFLSAVLLLKRNGHAIPFQVDERLVAMGAYIADYLRPDGTAPQIGDADNGRLHPLTLREMADHRYLPVVIASAYNRRDLRVVERDLEALWWIGDVPSRPGKARSSAIYAQRGFAILRGGGAHVFVSAAAVGMHGQGSHSHNDILSFEYWSQGRAWIVDPGTYLYTPDPASRNYFRSTQAHNTVRIDGSEINPFYADRLFQMTDRAPVMCNAWIDGDEVVEIDAQHDGYNGVRHRRRCRLNKATGDLEVQDSFDGEGTHSFEWFFHALPDTTVSVEGARARLCYGSRNLEIQAEQNGFPPVAAGFVPALVWEIGEGWYSPSYGVRWRSPVLTARLTRQVPFKLAIRIVNSHASDSRNN